MGRIIDDESARILGGVGSIVGLTALAYAKTIINPNNANKIAKKYNQDIDNIVCKSTNTCNQPVDHIGLIEPASEIYLKGIEYLSKDIQKKILAEPSKLKQASMLKRALRANKKLNS